MKKLMTSIILIAVFFLFASPCFAGLDPAEEARHSELKKMCAELKVPSPPEIFIRLQVHDKTGKLVFDDTQRGHSWIRNYYNVMAATIFRAGLGSAYEAGSLKIKQSNGTLENVWSWWINHAYIGSTIAIGTSSAAWSAENYALGALIASGSGSGQLMQGATTAGTPSYDAGTKTFSNTLVMVANNNSGGSITVAEVGLYGTNGNSLYLDRSVLSPTVAVAKGAQLTVTYTISMDFSAID